ncbi:cytidylate kinase [Lucifera butyrica]|uniref:Cytidylate kinase n=1 Tax=Lucifera butyrica TaxID=1351585 RepID=A0A498RCV1_9FIRM|nr:(d)CMP kinase [Lucifera butyrica]VBB07962.1 cytidylate kinase [Lucifera butyrica]
MRNLIIAIDGPAGAGKSTVAQIVARRLNYVYIDTGAMYRAVTWLTNQEKIPLEDAAKVSEMAYHMNLELLYREGKTTVRVNGLDVTQEIRTPAVSRLVPGIAQIAGVREAMLKVQREMAGRGGVVMDGRDIGTYVLPNADIKIFLTASVAVRAKRRWQELNNRGFTMELAQIEAEISARDKADCERDIAPLCQAPDAILVDTTDLTIEGAVTAILNICKERSTVV